MRTLARLVALLALPTASIAAAALGVCINQESAAFMQLRSVPPLAIPAFNARRALRNPGNR